MKNFIIVGVQRTGSSALAESIGLNQMVTCGWEWTQRVPWKRKIEVAERALTGDFSLLKQEDKDHMTKVFDQRKSWLGFRRLFRASNKWIIHPCFCPALWLDRLEDHIRWLGRRPDIHIIHIVRHEALDWLKSVYIARKTNLYVGSAYPKGIKCKIPVRSAIARLHTKNWIDRRLSTLKHTNPYLQLKYEDFLADQDAVTDSAWRFLGCNPSILNNSKPLIHKQSSGTAADYILNYDKLFLKLRRLNLLTSQFN